MLAEAGMRGEVLEYGTIANTPIALKTAGIELIAGAEAGLGV